MRIYNDVYRSKNLFGLRINNKSLQSYNPSFSASTRISGSKLTSVAASLDLPTQDIVESIYKKMRGLKQYFGKTNFQKAIEMRSKYPFIESKPVLRGGYSFSLFEGDEKGKSLSVMRSKNASDILRIVITEHGETENSTHFLIKGLDKVVANLNQKYPFMVPAKLRFMSAKELTESNVVKYIVLAEKELEKYYKFLQGEDSAAFPEIQKAKEEYAPKRKSPTESAMRVSKTQSEMTDKIFGIFDNTVDGLPKHISPMISPSSGKVLIINLTTDDDGSLRVSKTMNPEYGDKLRYISVRRIMRDGSKKFLAIDTATKKFLKVDSVSGRPLIPDGEPLFYSSAELESRKLRELFEDTYNQIFREVKDVETTITEHAAVLTLKLKEQAKVIDLDDIEAEPLDFEDKKLNAILDKSNEEQVEKEDSPMILPPEATQKRRGRKPKAITQTASETVGEVQPKRRGRKPKALMQTSMEEVQDTQPKRRGRKPKVKQDPVVEPVKVKPQTDETVKPSLKEQVLLGIDKAIDIEQVTQRIIKKAEEDAERLSQLYVDTLLTKFKENVQNAFNGVMEKITDLLKN